MATALREAMETVKEPLESTVTLTNEPDESDIHSTKLEKKELTTCQCIYPSSWIQR